MYMFDEVVEKAKGAMYVAGKKTGELVEVSKLKLKCVQLNGEIKDRYEKMGSAVYNMRKHGYENSELISSISAEIDDLLKQLDEVSQKVENIKNIIICSSCGKKNPNTSYYCSKCGNRISEEFKSEYSSVTDDFDKDEQVD